jgi:hypothetical protein
MEMIRHDSIENRIFNIRGEQVMFDYHLAELYGVETKRINEQVKRNLERFPATFMFQLTQQEWDDLRSQIATAKRRTLPSRSFPGYRQQPTVSHRSLFKRPGQTLVCFFANGLTGCRNTAKNKGRWNKIEA